MKFLPAVGTGMNMAGIIVRFIVNNNPLRQEPTQSDFVHNFQ
ncbi:hypothetical protein CJA_3520 [Cellvibrio japonicus Ueda107]|uniref:Uncharacterized protein n=1 Tax=Cellvibrio japonicus (strain Ueda107) TaxID=498211 RepID=B3PG66_CELJU|nr:hypothetical protein CJA_3520 [Cellvibrio japonicus Ueda107]